MIIYPHDQSYYKKYYGKKCAECNKKLERIWITGTLKGRNMAFCSLLCANSSEQTKLKWQ